MADKTNQTNEIKDKELKFTRILDAPRELVFEAWTDPQHLAEWWGPNGFTLTTHETDVKPGGEWIFTMHGPDGRDYPNRVHFIEVIKPERLVYRHSGDESKDPVNFNVTVTFEKQGNKTFLTMDMVFESSEVLTMLNKKYGAIEGAKQNLARLEAYLKSTNNKKQ
jgi:uncharacterized protein YndB with AHSA1/START domain